jgi:hypothetical protein
MKFVSLPLPDSRSQTFTVPFAPPAATKFSVLSNVTHSTGDCSPERLCNIKNDVMQLCCSRKLRGETTC